MFDTKYLVLQELYISQTFINNDNKIDKKKLIVWNPSGMLQCKFFQNLIKINKEIYDNL